MTCQNCGHHGTPSDPVEQVRERVGSNGPWRWSRQCASLLACWSRWQRVNTPRLVAAVEASNG